MRDRSPGTDYYRLMGLGPEATEEEIRKAYRRLAFECHPDRNPGKPEASERFKRLSEAYAVLVDPVKRRAYDAARRAGAPSDWSRQREDLFRDLFANPRASAVFEELAREFARSGMRVDRHYFQQTLFGGRAVVTGGVFVVTPLTPALVLFKVARAALRAAYGQPAARAPGHQPAGAPETRGQLTSGWAVLGRFVGKLLAAVGGTHTTSPAPRVVRDHDVILPLRLTQAEATEGARKRITVESETGPDDIVVTVPPGVRPGMKLRLKGRGRPSASGPRGDLYLVIDH
jgi:curved DNA-binding protein CbpA